MISPFPCPTLSTNVAVRPEKNVGADGVVVDSHFHEVSSALNYLPSIA